MIFTCKSFVIIFKAHGSFNSDDIHYFDPLYKHEQFIILNIFIAVYRIIGFKTLTQKNCMKWIAISCSICIAPDNIVCCIKYVAQESITCYLLLVLVGPIWGVISNGYIFREI